MTMIDTILPIAIPAWLIAFVIIGFQGCVLYLSKKRYENSQETIKLLRSIDRKLAEKK